MVLQLKNRYPRIRRRKSASSADGCRSQQPKRRTSIVWMIISILGGISQFFFAEQHAPSPNEISVHQNESSFVPILAPGPAQAQAQAPVDPQQTGNSAGGNTFSTASSFKKKKRHLVFHMGPPKTGSTTLQCIMREEADGLVAQDGYHLAETESCPKKGRGENSPTHGNGYLPKCLDEVEKYASSSSSLRVLSTMGYNETLAIRTPPPPSCWTAYVTVIRQQYEQGKNVIISNENIASVHRKDHTQLQPSFLDPLIADLGDMFEIHFIALYRHYFDWICSFYNQEFKQRWTKTRKFGEWPGVTKRAMATPRIIEYALEGAVQGQTGELDKWIPLYRDKELNSNIHFTILDLHDDDQTSSLETNFFCKAVPEMPALCQHLSAALKAQEGRDTTSIRRNLSSGGICYDMLATAAHARGWIEPGLSRHDVFRMARFFHREILNRTDADFPKACPTEDELGRLWDRSLLYAHRIFSTTVERETRLRNAFDDTRKKQTLCDVDVESVLHDTQWETFFKGLK